MARKAHSEKVGPDSSDVMDYWRAMRSFHGAVVRCELTPAFPQSIGNPVVRVRLIADPGPGPELESGPLLPVSVDAEYPTNSHSTFEDLLYALSHRLDVKVGSEWWRQRELPF